MPIPKLNGHGVLPPDGEPYPTTSLELTQRFGTTPDRIIRLKGLFGLRALMRDLGFNGGYQLLGGPFLEHDRLHSKPPPLIHVSTLCITPATFKDPKYEDLVAIATDRERTSQKFHVDHSAVHLSWSDAFRLQRIEHWTRRISRQASNGAPAGLVKLDLNTPSDDAEAMKYLKTMEARV